MFIQVFSVEDKNKLNEKGFKFICENKIGDRLVYTFDSGSRMNFDDLKIEYSMTNRLYF